MDSNERQRYEGTGHGGSLDERIAAFRRATSPEHVTICAWCPDAAARTLQAKTRGFIVTHSICTACQLMMGEQS